MVWHYCKTAQEHYERELVTSLQPHTCSARLHITPCNISNCPEKLKKVIAFCIFMNNKPFPPLKCFLMCCGSSCAFLLLSLCLSLFSPQSITNSRAYSFSSGADWDRMGCQRTHFQKLWRPNGSHG